MTSRESRLKELERPLDNVVGGLVRETEDRVGVD